MSEYTKLKMGDMEPNAVCYPDNTVAHRLRKDGNPEFSLDELKEIIHRWNNHDALLEVCKAMKKVLWMLNCRVILAGTLPGQIEQIEKQAEVAITTAEEKIQPKKLLVCKECGKEIMPGADTCNVCQENEKE